ncbi:unnamed protein product, partial [marine sediment metagenome]
MKKRIRKQISDKDAFIAVYFQNGIGNFIMLTSTIKALCEMHRAKVDIVLDDSWKDNRREA